MAIQESGEMYLETILLLSKESDSVRAVDVCEYMGFSKPSVSRALSHLKDDGYVQTDESNFLFLTEKGRETAERIFEKHSLLTEIFLSLGVNEKQASEDACKIEHVISDETFDAIKAHIKPVP